MIFDKFWTRCNGRRTDADIRAEMLAVFRGYHPLHGTKPRIEVDASEGP